MAQQKRKLANWSIEELIVVYAQNFYDETMKVSKMEQSILKELADRGVIDKDKMNELYKQKSLSYDNVI